MEIWGGIECTVNRVGERYFDQLAYLERYSPEEIADLIASVGVGKVRFPVLWERIAPNGLHDADWAWTDRALRRLREHGVAPIAGLVHHGSGPPDTHLLDPEFPQRLARFAGAVAARYPWITDYTPVNEPLTTARFSALYGLWYPHRREMSAMARAVFNECAGTAAAMDAIRQHVPAARLIQTEDLGKTYATPRLAYQADWENVRRWFSLDLLCGVGERNELVVALAAECGIDDLAPFVAAPDVLGFNYYITGERFLDERLEHYPENAHGGNGRDRYADVAAVRVCAEGCAGLHALLHEAWERYRRPLAVTESHLGCTREEQLRWIGDTYAQATAAAESGCDVRAFTVWALFGSHDWNTLLTRSSGHYEPGAFDVRSHPPRMTAIGRYARALATVQPFEHPVLSAPGWWRTVGRLEHPPVARDDPDGLPVPLEHGSPQPLAPLLILGAAGRLGRTFREAARVRGLRAVALGRDACDVTDEAQLHRALERTRPWAVIVCAGSRDPGDAEDDLATAVDVHYRGPLALARLCTRRGIRLVTFSSHAVFDDPNDAPSYESSPPRPSNSYALVKAAADAAILAAAHDALIVRSGELVGFEDDDVLRVVARLEAGAHVRLPVGDVFSLAHARDLADGVLDLLVDGEHGLWHLASPGEASWPEIVESLAGAAAAARILPATGPGRAQRPTYAVLASERAELLPPLERVLERLRSSRPLHARTGEEAAS